MISRRAAILTFMIGGPLLWLPVLFAWALIGGYDPRNEKEPASLISQLALRKCLPQATNGGLLAAFLGH